MNSRIAWYFDVISPYAYLHLKRFAELPPDPEIDYVPVLFAGLLGHWGTKGPVEVSCRRVHTYRHCVWIAQSLGIPFRMPPRHPFNPLAPLRLLIALGATRSAVEAVFDFIWGEGRDTGQEWPALCERLRLLPAEAERLTSDPAVKQRLVANTGRAIAAGVWGVPTFQVGDELFWGLDTLDWMNAYLADPTLHERGEMLRAAHAEVGAVRREAAPR